QQCGSLRSKAVVAEDRRPRKDRQDARRIFVDQAGRDTLSSSIRNRDITAETHCCASAAQSLGAFEVALFCRFECAGSIFSRKSRNNFSDLEIPAIDAGLGLLRTTMPSLKAAVNKGAILAARTFKAPAEF